jgi:NAD(P)H-quinone oxidoreductase subunit 6
MFGTIMSITASAVAFYLIAALMVGSAMLVAFSRNIVYSAFALLGTLVGSAAMFVILQADFVAATQVIVYVGGVAVLILFAVFLTQHIANVEDSNQHVGLPAAMAASAGVFMMVIMAVTGRTWAVLEVPSTNPTAHRIGNAFLKEYLLPFEFASVILLIVLVGAALVARREINTRVARTGGSLGPHADMREHDEGGS